jgi:hypothetical protein
LDKWYTILISIPYEKAEEFFKKQVVKIGNEENKN